jgi:hypothetical protein
MTDAIPAHQPEKGIIDVLFEAFADSLKGAGFNRRTLANLFTVVAVLCVLYGAVTVVLGLIRQLPFWYYDLGLYFVMGGLPTFLAGDRIRRDNA